MPLLVIEKGPDRGQNIPVSDASPFVVGRGTQAGFKLNDNAVSREHFTIYAKEGKFYIQDMGSLNGTQVDGKAIAEAELLLDGTQIQVGETAFTWMEKAKSASIQDPLLNQTLGGYQILKRLGRGGMGTVYLARQLSLQRDVAIKVLSPQLGQNENFIRRLVEEARASATLNHPNILQVYDVGSDEGHHYFSMEYAQCGSIQRLIEGQKRLPVDEAVRYMLHTAKGLEYAERKKIVHRDIKPDNLMLSEDKVVKIGDLGLAKRLDQRAGPKEEGVYGTPHFIAPEQLQNKDIDHRADMYAFGASFYRILAGRTPFEGKNIQQIMMKQVSENPPPIESIVPELPEDLCRIVHTMMEKDRERRFPGHAQVIEEIEKLQRKMERTDKYSAVEKGYRRSKTSTIRKERRNTTRELSRTGAYRRDRKKKQPSAAEYLLYAGLATVLGIVLLALFLMAASNQRSAESSESKDARTAEQKPVESPTANTGRRPEDRKAEVEQQGEVDRRYAEIKSYQFGAADPAPFMEEFQKIVREHPRSEAAGRARKDLDELLEQCVLAPSREQQSAGRLPEAFRSLREFEKIFDFPWRERIHERQRELEAALESRLVEVELEIIRCQERSDLGGIREKLEWLAKASEFASPLVKGQCGEIAAKWAPSLQKTEEEREGDADGRTADHYEKIVQRTLANRNYRQGAQKLQEFLARLDKQGKPYPPSWRATSKDMENIHHVFEGIEAALKQEYPLLEESLKALYAARTKNSRIQNVSAIQMNGFDKDRMRWSIYMKAGGSVEHLVPLSEVEPLWLYENLMAPKPSPPELWWKTALFCYYHGLYRKAWDCCQRSAKNEPKSEGLLDVQARLERVEAEAERAYRNEIVPLYRELQAKVGGGEALEADLLAECREEAIRLRDAMERFSREYGNTRFHESVNREK